MQHSSASHGPRIAGCPHCGAPLDAEPDQRAVRCKYCGHLVKLGQTVPRAPYAAPVAPPVPPLAPSVPAVPTKPLIIALAVGFVVLVVGGALFASAVGTAPATPTPTPEKQVTRYPLRALQSVNVDVDVDGAKQHMLQLFPSVEAELGSDLSFRVPLRHPWFGKATFHWKNARAGKLNSFQLDPPEGVETFKNQREIADCLTKALGNPEASESNHLAGQWSYFWHERPPAATANLSAWNLWLELVSDLVIIRSPHDRTADAPAQPLITLKHVLTTLDACAPSR